MLSELVARYDELCHEKNKHRTNLPREKLECCLQLCKQHVSLELYRGALKYADTAIDLDATAVEAHVTKVQALDHLNKPRALRAAAEAGLVACSKVACVEGLGSIRRNFQDILGRQAPTTAAQSANDPAAASSAVTDVPAIPIILSTSDDKPPDAKYFASAASAPVAPESVAPSSGASASVVSASVASTVSVASASVAQPSCRLPPAAFRRKSAWNSKDTWEEIDTTDWAVDRLAELIEGATFTLPSVDGRRGAVKMLVLQNAVGHAQIVYFQGKRRFLFDIGFELTWLADISFDGATPSRRRFKGTCEVGGLEQDVNDPMDLTISAPFKKTDEEATAVREWLEGTSITAGAPGEIASLRKGIFGIVKEFEREFFSHGSASDGKEDEALGHSTSEETAEHSYESRRSQRRRSPHDPEKSKTADILKKERAAASAISDLRRSNPGLKLCL